MTSSIGLITRHGFAAFSLRAAARDVGVSANAAYRHFQSKSELLEALANHGFDMLAKEMVRAMNIAAKRSFKGPLAVERFKAIGRAYIEFANKQPEIFRLMFGDNRVSGSGVMKRKARNKVHDRSPWKILGASLDALVEDGFLHTERRYGAELKAWTIVHGFACLDQDEHANFPKGQERVVAIESLLEFAVNGLCGPLSLV